MNITHLIIFIIAGLYVGSYLTVVIYRIPKNISTAVPSVHCPSCNTPLKWYDTIPVLSYIMLRGKCRECGSSISIKYMIVEIITALMFVVCYFCGHTVSCRIVYCLISSTLISTIFVDIEHRFIPDRFCVVLAILGGLLCIYDKSTVHLIDRVIGCIGCAVLYRVYYYSSLNIIKRESIRIGTVKLMTACGIILGWQLSILAIILGTIFVGVMMIILAIFKKKTDIPAYASCMGLSVLLALLFGIQILNAFNIFI